MHNPLSISDQLTMKPPLEVEQKVAELIQECFTNQRAVKMLLTSWVDKELIPNHIEIGVLTITVQQSIVSILSN